MPEPEFHNDFIARVDALRPDRLVDTSPGSWAARAAALLFNMGQTGLLRDDPDFVEEQFVELLARVPTETLLGATFMTIQARARTDADGDN